MCIFTPISDMKPKDILPTVTSCCLFFSLRTGSLIIGWYYLLTGVLAVVTMLPKGYDFISHLSTTGDTGSNVARLLVVESYFLIWILIVASMYLLNGIRKKIPSQVRPFVVYSALYLIYDIFVILLVAFTPLQRDIEAVMQPYWGETASWLSGNPYFLLIDAVIDVNFLLVVYSYYKQLSREVSQNNPGDVV